MPNVQGHLSIFNRVLKGDSDAVSSDIQMYDSRHDGSVTCGECPDYIQLLVANADKSV